MNFRIMILRKIDFDIILYSVLFVAATLGIFFNICLVRLSITVLVNVINYHVILYFIISGIKFNITRRCTASIKFIM